jgi:hypothetical protein
MCLLSMQRNLLALRLPSNPLSLNALQRHKSSVLSTTRHLLLLHLLLPDPSPLNPTIMWWASQNNMRAHARTHPKPSSLHSKPQTSQAPTSWGCCMRVIRALAHLPPPQRDGAYLFMTLHGHKVDDRTIVEDGSQPMELAAGWEVAPCDADGMRVCGAHAWQSTFLVFADGCAYGTAICKPSRIGKCDACGCCRFGGGDAKTKLKSGNFASRVKTGKDGFHHFGGLGCLKRDGARVSSTASQLDVLLRKRA